MRFLAVAGRILRVLQKKNYLKPLLGLMLVATLILLAISPANPPAVPANTQTNPALPPQRYTHLYLNPEVGVAPQKNRGLSFGFSKDEIDLISNTPLNILSLSPDFTQLGKQIRVISKLHHMMSGIHWVDPAALHNPALSDLRQELDEKFFKWMFPSFQSTIELRKSYSGSGIVLCVGDKNVDMALQTLYMIRAIHHCELPVEIFYMGDEDLSAENRSRLLKVRRTKAIDILKLVDDSLVMFKESRGWAIKPFALLLSSFSEVIVMDADVVFLQSPETILKDKKGLYRKRHALFYTDRTLHSTDSNFLDFFNALVNNRPSKSAKALRMLKRTSLNEQESGVVAVDKRRHFGALLAVCLLNVGPIRVETYKKIHGDKETFWIGFEVAQHIYTMNTHYPGAAGVATKQGDKYTICSRQLLHVDHKNEPLWINGGITTTKFDPSSPLADMRSWAVEPGTWELKESEEACLTRTEPPGVFSEKMKRVIQRSGDIILSYRQLNGVTMDRNITYDFLLALENME